MPFLIGLLSPVFTQRMSPFNSLLSTPRLLAVFRHF